MAYPTQLRGSLDPCVSQVFDEAVIQIRKYRTGIGALVSRMVCVPPWRREDLRKETSSTLRARDCASVLQPRSNTERENLSHKDPPRQCEACPPVGTAADREPPIADARNRSLRSIAWSDTDCSSNRC